MKGCPILPLLSVFRLVCCSRAEVSRLLIFWELERKQVSCEWMMVAAARWSLLLLEVLLLVVLE